MWQAPSWTRCAKKIKTASHLGSTRGCTTSIIWWTFGPGADPAVQIPLEQLGAWIDFWQAADAAMRSRVRRAWKSVMPALVKAHSRWPMVKGFMSATIATVADLGWRPASPSHWRVNEGMMAVLDEVKYAKAHILEAAYRTLISNLAKRAEDHQHGGGIGCDLHMQGVRMARRRLVRDGKAAEVVALDHIAVGAVWDPPLNPMAPPRPEHLCQRCGGRELATSLHDYYHCPDNFAVDCTDGVVDQATAELIAEGRREACKHPCLWFRGLIPSELVEASPRPSFDETAMRTTTNLESLLATTRHGYSDGSGGVAEAVPSQRRVYSGAATYIIDGEGEEVTTGGLVAEVPGKQTVPRAELWGASLLLSLAPRDGPFEITLDAAYVVNGLGRRIDRFRGANGDLWAILARMIDARGGATEISKVKSHVLRDAREQVAARAHNWRHILGNELADAAADAGPALFPQEVGAASRRARFVEDKAARVAVRLAKIRARIWAANRGAAIYQVPEEVARDEQERAPQHAAASILKAVATNGHKLVGFRDGFKCSICGAVRGWRRREYWASVNCRPRLPASEVVKRLRTGCYTPSLPPTAPVHLASAASGAEAAPGETGLADGGDGKGGLRRGHGDGTSGADERTGKCKRVRRGEVNPREGDDCDLTDQLDIGHGVISGTAVNVENLGDDGGYDTGQYTVVNDEAYGSVGDHGTGEYTAISGEPHSHHVGYGSSNIMGVHSQGGSQPSGFNLERGDGALLSRPPYASNLDDAQFDVFAIPDEALGGDELVEHPFDVPPNDEDLHDAGTEDFERHDVGAQPLLDQVPRREAPTPASANVTRRRLTGKTNPTRAAALGHGPLMSAQAGPTEVGLVTREVARAARKRHREAALLHAKAVKQARTAAWSAIRRNPEATGGPEDPEREVLPEPRGEAPAVPALWDVHPSHDAAASPGVQVVFCRRCGAWSLGVKSKNLVRPCSLKPGHSGNLRLLHLGIVPRRGARVPTEFKQAGARGTRGGSASRRSSRTRGGRR